jgi:hypothetical protein
VIQAHLLHAIIGDTSVVRVETDLFKGQIFWVLRGDEQHTKPELEVLIKKYGGKQSQSDQQPNTIIIAGLHGELSLNTRGGVSVKIFVKYWF